MSRKQHLLAPSSEVYQELFELSPMSMAVIDPEGRCLLFNRAFVERFGYDRETLLRGAVRFADFFDRPATARGLVAEIQAKQIVRRREVQFKDKNGERFAALLSGRTLALEGRPALEIALVNIAPQKQLELQLRRDHARMASLIDGLTTGLFLVNKHGHLTDFNNAAARLLGVEQSAMADRPYQELFGCLMTNAAEPEAALHSLSRATVALVERPVVLIELKEEERNRSLELTFFPVWGEDSAPIGWGGLIQDVTEAHNRLAWKLELLAILAHDIRAPLAALKGHATALLSNYRQWSDEMVIEFLEVINRRTDELVRQVDRSLALTRVEAGRLGLRPEAVDPKRLIEQAVERVAASLAEARVEFDVPADLPQVRADPARAEEVLINLLDNAARYTPPGEPITIHAQADAALLQISVADRGPGVPADQQPTLFEKYQQSESGGAAGLGLFICRKIVEAHGGRIWVESSPEGAGGGARFVFTLPLMPVAASQSVALAPASAPVAVGQPAKGQRVLVVEDEPDFQALLRTVLTQAGYAVEIAPNGPAAIDLVQTAPPDLMLLDMVLPGMDGVNVCRNIRRWSNIPILIVTSKTAQADLVIALDAGADDYVTKPFQSGELLARIRALLRRGDAWVEEEPMLFHAEGLSINFDSREVWLSGQRVALTPTEYDLLAHLARHRGQVLTYDQLLDRVYEQGEGRSRHDLFVHISRLRKKIEPEPDTPRFLLTRRGVGYMFAPE